MMGFNLNRLHYQVTLSLLIYNLTISTVLATRNVTIDDQDSSITYSPPGAWSQSTQSTLDFGGAHTLTQNSNATASFNFTGIAIYFLSPLWPYTVNTAVSLDSGPITVIDLVDHSRPNTGQGPETAQYQVVWNATGLANTQHNLRISVGAGQPFAVVDGLIYTDATNVSSSPTSSLSPTSTLHDPVIASSTANATLTSSAKSKSRPVVAIVLGSLFGILGLLVVLWAVWYFFRRRKRPVSEAWTDGTPYTSSRNPSMSAVGTNAINKNGDWTADQLYNNGYSISQSNDGKTWYNQRYENVGMPAPPIPPQPYYHGGYQNGTNSYTTMNQAQRIGRISNRYEPGYALSTITERSTPQMGEGRTPLANSPSSHQQSELEYYTAVQGSEASYSVSRQQLPSSLGGAHSPNSQGYPSPRRKPVEPKAGNWI